MASSSSELPVSFGTETGSTFSYKHATEEEILEDLTSRFILNLPDEELTSLERICFQIEQAHWFYEDFIREANPKFPPLPLKRFTAMMFTHCPVLQHWNHEEAFDKFMKYKTQVPVCGAIMLNETWDKCVLVKGWKSSSGWGFPKGKINETEEKSVCAVREVLEETGYNLAGQINPEHYLETVNNGQIVTLFIVPGVPEDYPFRTKTRKEISKIEWFKLVDLPAWKKGKSTPGKFYLILPFISPLRKFVLANKPKKGRKSGTIDKGTPNKGKHSIPPPESDGLQDSSSQSSSLDNGDPQTPSPQYTESTPAYVPEIVGDRSESTVPVESLDPHFARLLSGLSLSAVSAPLGKPESQFSTPQNPPGPFDATSPSTPPMSSLFTAVASPAVVTADPKSKVDIQPTHDGLSAISEAGSTASTAQSVTATSPTLSMHSPRSPSARRSSTADISPYLSRAVEAPLSARRLQQLALLESVANESARMTPMLPSSNPGNVSAGPQPFPPPSLHHSIASQPSSHVYPNQRVGPPSGPIYPPSFGSNLPPHDPFMIRSRTSQGLHRTGFHGALGSMSMSQHQLLSLINGSRPGGAPAPPVQLEYSPPSFSNSFGPQAMHGPGPRPLMQPVPLMHPQMGQFGPPPHPFVVNSARPFSTASMGPAPPLATKPLNPSANSLLSLLSSGTAPTHAQALVEQPTPPQLPSF